MVDLRVDTPAEYELSVQGDLGTAGLQRFDELTVTYQQPITTLRGKIQDQSALLGILRQLINLGLPVLAVRHITSQSEKETT